MPIEGYVYENGIPRCPTEICKAVCCRTASFRPDRLGPCLEPTSDTDGTVVGAQT